MTTKLKIDQQRLFLSKVAEGKEVTYEDVFGSSEFLITMLNGGTRAAKLAYSRAHLKIMKIQNKNSQVLQVHNLRQYFCESLTLQILISSPIF